MSDLSATVTVRWTPPAKNGHLVSGYQVQVVDSETGVKSRTSVTECEYVHRLNDVSDSFHPILISVRAVSPHGSGNFTNELTVSPKGFKDLALIHRNFALLQDVPGARPVALEQTPATEVTSTAVDTTLADGVVDRRIMLELPDASQDLA